MAINFPDAPSVNQTFTVGDKTWKWTGAVWETVTNRPPTRTASDTPPSSPIASDEWFNTSNSRLYIWYDNFWVEQGTPALQGTPGADSVISATAPIVYNSGTKNVSLSDSPTITTDASGQALKLKARSTDQFNQLAWYKSNGSTFMNLWQVGGDTSIAFVQNTAYASDGLNFVERFRINGSGHVTVPNQPVFQMTRGYTTDGAAWPNGAQFTFSSKPYDNTSSANTSNGRFTAPSAGHYQFNFMSSQTSSVDLGDFMLAINGSPDESRHTVAVFNASKSGWDTNTISGILYLNAGDYVDVRSTCCWGGKPTAFRFTFSGFKVN